MKVRKPSHYRAFGFIPTLEKKRIQGFLASRSPCLFQVRNVITHELEDRMESFFLAETTKYLYLLFDENNFIHKHDGSESPRHNGVPSHCLMGSLGYVFNTEAHPLDIGAIRCCKTTSRSSQNIMGRHLKNNTNDLFTGDEHLTGKHRCKPRPFYQRLFTNGVYLEDKDDLFW